ncbi:MAG: Amuc_1100 family pilus-like protein [Verrucomicrobiota bacterium]
MDWIKRNLIFVIGGVVTLLLMGLAGWYCYSGWTNNAQQKDEIAKAYEELNTLYSAKPSPGDGRKVDNIKLAKEQQKEAEEFLQALGRYLQEIPAIPALSNVSGPRFSAALQETITQLQREATNSSVIIPPGYKFSFGKQATLVTFAPGSLDPLAVQLGEVRAICDVLNQAKVNSLDGIRRERVPGNPDDLSGTAADYLDLASTTNELAVISPYEITFHCFTPELAAVLAGFAQSPYGLMVKAINVEPAMAMVADAAAAPVYAAPVAAPAYVPPAYAGQRPPGRPGREEGGGIPSRYAGAGGASPYGTPSPYGNPNPYGVAQPAGQPVAYATAPAKSGLQTFLKEKQLKVTLLLHVIKLLPPQK